MELFEEQRNSTPQVTLFLMTEKGYHFLKRSLEVYKPLIALVVVGRDRSIQDDFEKEIIELCAAQSIKYVKRSSAPAVKTIYAMAVSWRWLINHPESKLVIFHDSPLPKYRGFAPLVNSLINGEKEIGVTALFGASDFDTGSIIAQSTSTVTYPLKIQEAIKLNNENYFLCAKQIFERLLRGETLRGVAQLDSSASYSVWLDENDYKIDWNKSAVEIRRFIDATGYPYRGAFTYFEGKLVRILKAEEAAEVNVENRHFGKALFFSEGKPVIICGQGMLKITEAVVEGDGNDSSLFPINKFRIRFTQ